MTSLGNTNHNLKRCGRISSQPIPNVVVSIPIPSSPDYVVVYNPEFSLWRCQLYRMLQHPKWSFSRSTSWRRSASPRRLCEQSYCSFWVALNSTFALRLGQKAFEKTTGHASRPLDSWTEMFKKRHNKNYRKHENMICCICPDILEDPKGLVGFRFGFTLVLPRSIWMQRPQRETPNK